MFHFVVIEIIFQISFGYNAIVATELHLLIHANMFPSSHVIDQVKRKLIHSHLMDYLLYDIFIENTIIHSFLESREDE